MECDVVTHSWSLSLRHRLLGARAHEMGSIMYRHSLSDRGQSHSRRTPSLLRRRITHVSCIADSIRSRLRRFARSRGRGGEMSRDQGGGPDCCHALVGRIDRHARWWPARSRCTLPGERTATTGANRRGWWGRGCVQRIANRSASCATIASRPPWASDWQRVDCALARSACWNYRRAADGEVISNCWGAR